MQKIKVLLIIKSLGRGGAEMLLPETLKLHDKDKFEFHYIYFLPWKNQLVEEIENAGGVVTCLNASNNLKILQKYSQVIRYCKEHEIGLVHCHLPWAGVLGRIVYSITRIPVIYTEHNMQERYHKATKIINKITFNSQSIALGVSNDVSNSIKTNIKPSIPVKTLLNGVNTKSFKKTSNLEIRDNFNIDHNTIVIGNVAVFRFQKRLVEWLRVFREIHSKNPNVRGIIVGAGPLENEVMQELNALKLEKYVYFPGLQTNVKPYFEAMDIFMMSSSFEGLPIALLEGMSMECAVVSTNAGGIKELIRNEIDGLTCEVENWQKLPDLCQQLIDNAMLLGTYKKAARDRVINEFSLTKMVASLENYYEQYNRITDVKN